MADEAIGYIKQLKEIAPRKPTMKRSTSARIRAPGWRRLGITTTFLSSLPARSTS